MAKLLKQTVKRELKGMVTERHSNKISPIATTTSTNKKTTNFAHILQSI